MMKKSKLPIIGGGSSSSSKASGNNTAAQPVASSSTPTSTTNRNSSAQKASRHGNKASQLISAAVCCGSSQHRKSIDDPRDVKPPPTAVDEPKLPAAEKCPPLVSEEETSTVAVSIPVTAAHVVPSISVLSSENNGNAPDSTFDRLVKFGPIKFVQPVLSVLLIFPHGDNQGSVLREACRRLGCTINLAGDLDTAMDAYLAHRHNVVIVDTRKTSKAFDHFAVCRAIRSTNFGHEAVVVALISKSAEATPVLNLLRNGYSRHFVENQNVMACYNELLSLEHSDVRQQLRLRSAVPLFTALELCNDAVEVSDADWNILYINSAHERLFGYSAEDIVDKKAKDFVFNCARNPPELQKNIEIILKRGRLWEGHQYVQSKTGEVLRSQCHCMGISCSGKEVQYVVTVRHAEDVSTPVAAGGAQGGMIIRNFKSVSIPTEASATSRTPSVFSAQSTSADRGRRSTMASSKMRPAITPATEVMNVLSTVSEMSTPEVQKMLEKVIETLGSTELFRPTHMGSEDEITREFVEGLMVYRTTAENVEKGHGRKGSVILATPLERDEVAVDFTSPETIALVDGVMTWTFDVFQVEKVTGRPLLYVGLATFNDFNTCDLLNTDERTLTKFLVTLESKYRPNPYHNSTHAADVVQAMAFYLDRCRSKDIFDDYQYIAGLIAAAAHDLDHVGRTNAFLINASHQLAVLYNDHAVLENHHASLLFQLASLDEKINIFANLQNATFKSMRQMIIDMILATEMSRHFEHVNRFVSAVGQRQSSKAEQQSAETRVAIQPPNELYRTPENRLIILRMMIKCADVSNPTRSLSCCIEWARRISEEYFQQTDEEKSRGLPVVMPVFDRKTCRLPSSQTSFIDFFLVEMFDAFHDLLDIPELIANLEDNYEYWKAEDRKCSMPSRAASLAQPNTNDPQPLIAISSSTSGGALVLSSAMVTEGSEETPTTPKENSVTPTTSLDPVTTVPPPSNTRRPSLPDTANIKST